MGEKVMLVMIPKMKTTQQRRQTIEVIRPRVMRIWKVFCVPMGAKSPKIK